MAGTLTIDTLKASSGSLATQNGMTGIVKAWIYYKGTATRQIYSSFNVSSVTANGSGDYTINLTTATADANLSAVGSCDSVGVLNVVKMYQNPSSAQAPTSTSVRMVVGNSLTNQDVGNLAVIICGN